MRHNAAAIILIPIFIFLFFSCGSSESEAPQAAPAAAPVDRTPVPYEDAFPDDFKDKIPLRIGVISSPKHPKMGNQMAAIIGRYQRNRLEKALGMRIKIAYVSKSQKLHGSKTVIQYRPKFMRAALKVASVMPQDQELRPMGPAELQRTGVDVLVHLADNLK